MKIAKQVGSSAFCALVLAAGPLFAQNSGPGSPDAAPSRVQPTDIELADLIRARLGGPGGPSSPDANDPKRFRDFAEITKGATRHEGLFTLHQKDDHLYAEIRPNQFDQPLYLPIMIARGVASAGVPVEDDCILVFRRVGDKVQVIERNTHYKAPAGTPIEKAVRQNYTDSVLMAIPIVALNPAGGMSVVIDLSDIFFSDFAQLGMGFLDRSRTNWFKVKAFPNNLELEVQATFSGGGSRGGRTGGDTGVADSRGVTVVVHYSLVRLPDPGYRPRIADDRVGHFISASKDFGSPDPDSNFVRYINRWRLEKSDPRAKVSPPKKQIVWWIEDTVPIEYRPYVEAGILEWNKAFEKAGIKNALAVRWQTDRDEFDPEDVNYCTLRWITTNRVYAMSCFRANPLTGEILDGDVIFDAGWIKAWKQQYALLTGIAPPAGRESAFGEPLATAEIISPIMADKHGFGTLGHPLARTRAMTHSHGEVEAIPADWSPFQIQLQKRLAQSSRSLCLYSTGLQAELGLAALVFAEQDQAKKDGEKKEEKKDGEKKEEKPAAATPTPAPEPRLPEEFLGQMIKEVVMHEVGHSLGLRHNFRASAMLTPEQINDTAITSVKGQAGSVMDYNPINLAPKGTKQGDYTTQTLGPYDYWVIEYAYREILGDEAGELKKIAARSPEPELTFGSDEDRMVNNDPLTNTYDLSSDNLRYAQDRIALVETLLKDLDGKVVRDGESWSRLRDAFGLLMSQYGNSVHLASNYIGGQYVVRHHKGDKGAADPIIPVEGDKQRQALKLLVDHVLSGKSFQFSPTLLRRLAAERWMHWGTEMGGSVDIGLYDRVLSLQRIALSQAMAADTLQRIQNQELQSDPNSKPLKLDEVFRTLTDGIWSETKAGEKGYPETISTIRRNLQREHLKRLSGVVIGSGGGINLGDSLAFLMVGGGGGYPADARSLARMHLGEIGARITQVLKSNTKLDDTTRAHLEESSAVITKVLAASLNAREP
ncbi:MAG: zinc-dependent metalloprotease [Isosphaeraceae bacterium]|nr:zinc-dependent metalloprotease [Isosphaeraceae bacterium]